MIMVIVFIICMLLSMMFALMGDITSARMLVVVPVTAIVVIFIYERLSESYRRE